jgi:hypothetical protein
VPADDGVQFPLDEIVMAIEDLMRVADELLRSGDEVNAFLIDQVANRLLIRAFRGDE